MTWTREDLEQLDRVGSASRALGGCIGRAAGRGGSCDTPAAGRPVQASEAIDTHDWRMPNGRHEGERITRVPVAYLKWMVNVKHSYAAHAEAELKRRGTVTPELEVSGHAIDRASLTCLSRWRETRNDGEGLHAWLCRMAAEALQCGTPHKNPGRYAWKGVSFRFELDLCWPVLKTVMPEKPR